MTCSAAPEQGTKLRIEITICAKTPSGKTRFRIVAGEKVVNGVSDSPHEAWDYIEEVLQSIEPRRSRRVLVIRERHTRLEMANVAAMLLSAVLVAVLFVLHAIDRVAELLSRLFDS